ncbi:sugar transferase [Gracilimonas sediminicola]|uniref:Sugar transferase n=1 Tax=Gracilimonas sediminicola TaxID=2952158 RepID=A0A9X2L4S4_9BACT|nr:sugar transferase [Gracilimonas sediminicola]MCP9292284.1 sugar transferase [Gracilimonas sediminicola]
MVKSIRFILALTLILFLSPLLLIVSICIYISDPGSVLFKALRVGKGGEVFTIYKFRSMKNSKAGSKITSKNDDRIFGFGKLIRKTKLDELPQLLNILKGDMAFIGPRPENVEIVENYYDDFLRKSLKVKPGLASPGSLFNYTHLEELIEGDNAEEIYLDKILKVKVGVDVLYADKKNIIYDLKICLKTISTIVKIAFGKKQFNYPIEYEELKKKYYISL